MKFSQQEKEAGNDSPTLQEFACSNLQAGNQFTFSKNHKLMDFPADTDFNRFDLYHDGEDYRILLFQKGSTHTLYQGSYDHKRGAFCFGKNTQPVLSLLTEATDDIDCKSFAVLGKGKTAFLFLRPNGKFDEVFRFKYVPARKAFLPSEEGYRIPVVSPGPNLTWTNWSVISHKSPKSNAWEFTLLADLAEQQGLQLAPGKWDGSQFVFSEAANEKLPVFHEGEWDSSFALLSDGVKFRLYSMQGLSAKQRNQHQQSGAAEKNKSVHWPDGGNRPSREEAVSQSPPPEMQAGKRSPEENISQHEVPESAFRQNGKSDFPDLPANLGNSLDKLSETFFK